MAGPIPLTAVDPVRLGDWELLGRLGSGGQGVVYLGRPASPGEGPLRVAVKLLHAQLLGNAGARERFVRELALLQRVAGFCTAQMLAADTEGDRPYIVSEYVPGRSLRALVHEEGPRAGADLDRLAISSVTALSAIHRANVVHRDLKPQNVLMGPDGPRVIDFGIARAFDAGATLTSQVVGTPAYMAPEQFAGRVGPATDLFAWASTLLFAATGRDPFAGGALPAVMYRIMHETPDLAVLPSPLADVAAACLAKDPKARPTSEDVLLWLLGERERHARLDTATEQVPAPAKTTPYEPARDRPGRTNPGQDLWSAGTQPWPGQPPPTQNPQPDGATFPVHPGQDPRPGDPRPQSRQSDGPRPRAGRQPIGTDTSREARPGNAEPGENVWPGGAASPVQPGQDSWSGQPGRQLGGTDAGQQAWPGRADFGQSGRGPAEAQGQHGWAGSTEPYPGRPLGGADVGHEGWSGRAESAGWGDAGDGAGAGAYRRLRRGPALVAGLLLAGLLAALDVIALAVLIAVPSLTVGHRGGLLPLVASSFAVVAIVTLVAVILAWRGSRAAAWTVMAARVVRIGMWAAWGALVDIDAAALTGHAVLTALVVILLARALSRSPR